MNHLLRYTNVLVLCCVSLLLFGLHANVGQSKLVETATHVAAHWEPGTESWRQLPRNAPQYADLFDLKAASAFQMHSNDVFGVFLPPSSDSVAGDVWAFDVRQMLPFLRQFHPGATVSLSGQQGAYACLRAASSEYYEIVFQFHADFNLEIRRKMEEVMFEETIEVLEEAIAGLKEGETSMAIDGLRQEIPKVKIEELESLETAIESLNVKLDSANVKLDSADDLANLKKELAETVASLTKVTTTLEGLSGDLETRLNELKTTIAALENLVSNLESRLDEIEKRLTAHFDAKLNELEKKLAKNLDARLDEFQKTLTTTLVTEFNTLQKMLTLQERTLTQQLNTLLTAEVAKLKGTQAYNEGIYLMPQQFKGRLLISKSGGEVVAFTIKCPAQDENATLFVFGDTETVSMPRMALIAGNFDKHNITWTNAITAEEADEALRLKFAARKSHTENALETQ